MSFFYSVISVANICLLNTLQSNPIVKHSIGDVLRVNSARVDYRMEQPRLEASVQREVLIRMGHPPLQASRVL